MNRGGDQKIVVVAFFITGGGSDRPRILNQMKQEVEKLLQEVKQKLEANRQQNQAYGMIMFHNKRGSHSYNDVRASRDVSRGQIKALAAIQQRLEQILNQEQ